jgi:hypothetical protein
MKTDWPSCRDSGQFAASQAFSRSKRTGNEWVAVCPTKLHIKILVLKRTAKLGRSGIELCGILLSTSFLVYILFRYLAAHAHGGRILLTAILPAITKGSNHV